MTYKHLTEDERYQIEELRRENFSKRRIAKQLGRSPSTITRELHRNRGDYGYGWRARHAQVIATSRLTKRGSANAKRVSEMAWDYAKNRLQNDQWSPEQISGRLKLDKLESISHETIYQRILEDKKAGGSLYSHLRRRKKRKKRYGSGKTARGAMPNRVGIEKRPAIVDKRKRIGDWEGDTIIGSAFGGAVIASMVERKSRFICLSKAKNRVSTEVINSINNSMRPIANLVLTITLDNGKEFFQHALLTDALKADVYFARPYHSWERGLNENTNGLVRQYFPRRIPFDKLTEHDLRQVADKINNRPRKCLGYRTPLEVFSKSCKKRGVALRI